MRTLFFASWVIATFCIQDADVLICTLPLLHDSQRLMDQVFTKDGLFQMLEGIKREILFPPFYRYTPLFLSPKSALEAMKEKEHDIKSGRILLCWLKSKPHHVEELSQVWDWAHVSPSPLENSIGCYTQGMVDLGILSGSLSFLALVEVKNSEKVFMTFSGKLQMSPMCVSSLHQVSQFRRLVSLKNVVSLSIHEVDEDSPF